MSDRCIVLIAAPELLPALKTRVEQSGTVLLAFTDAEALRALEVVTKRRPTIVALERQFAGTPRGAALINRIKGDPALVESEIRVVSDDTDYSRSAPRRPPETQGGTAAAVAAAPAVTAKQPIDQRGTRRAARFKVKGRVEILVDGNQAVLVDLSTIGAQVISPTVLKPNQRVRISLSDEKGAVRFNASVAWASFEIPSKAGPQYRAGVEFLDAESTAMDAYCKRHKA